MEVLDGFALVLHLRALAFRPPGGAATPAIEREVVLLTARTWSATLEAPETLAPRPEKIPAPVTGVAPDMTLPSWVLASYCVG